MLLIMFVLANAQYVKQFLQNLQDLSIFTTQPSVYTCSVLNYDFVLMNMEPIQNQNVSLNISLEKAHFYIHAFVDYIFLGNWTGQTVQVLNNDEIIDEFQYTSTEESNQGIICSMQSYQMMMNRQFNLYHLDDFLILKFQLKDSSSQSSSVQYPPQFGIRNLQLNISECHSTCLTCSGPLETDCRQCPNKAKKGKKTNTCKCPLDTPYISLGECSQFCKRNEFPDYFNNCQIQSGVLDVESSLFSSFDYGQNNKSNYWGLSINGTTRDQLLFLYNDYHLFGKFGEKQQLKIRLGQLSGHYKVRIRFNLFLFNTWAVGEYVLTIIDNIRQLPYLSTTDGIINVNVLKNCSDQNQCQMGMIEHYQIHTSSDLVIQIYSDTYQQSISTWAISMFSVDILQCTLNCQKCESNETCNSCVSGYLLYKNKCVVSCPLEYTQEDNGKCLEMDDYSNQTSYLMRALLNSDLQGTIQQRTTYYNGYRHLAGISTKYPILLKQTFSDLYPHYQIRASFKIDIINIQSSQGKVVISLNNLTQEFESDPNKFIQQTTLNFTMFHIYNKLDFEMLQYPLPASENRYFKSGISNIMIVIDYCFPTCASCIGPSKEECLQWSIEPDFDFQSMSCIHSTYLENNTCIKCDSKCLQCNSQNQCLSCQGEYTLSGYQCYCRSGYYQDSDNQCYKCYDTCQGCTGPNQEDCYELSSKIVSCSISKGFEWGQECNDGNNVIRDGCSNCIIDYGWSCNNTLGQYSQCIPCPSNCQNCLQKDSIIECIECEQGYFYYNSGCFKCKDGCAACDYINQCTKCSISNILPLNGKCQSCSNEDGYYEIDGECQSQCGDFIQTNEEQCDDGNLLNGDGCSSTCTIESGFTCANGICQQIVLEQMQLKYSNKTTTNTLKLNFGNYTATCDQSHLKIYLENFESKDFKVFLTLVNEDQEKFCQISFKFYKNVRQSDLIHVLFYNNAQRLLIDLNVQELIIEPRPENYYSDDEYAIAQNVQEMQNKLVSAFYFLGPATVLLGGFNFFFSILDIFAWLNNFYFINVMYPPNVNILFLNPAWSIINPFDFTPIQIDEGEADYIESPLRFEQKGVDPYFLNNMMMSLATWLLCASLYPLCKGTVILIEKYFQRSPKQKIKIVQTKQLPIFQLDQSIESQQPEIETKIQQQKQYPALIQYVYEGAYDYQISFRAIMIKQLNLIYLDLCMASILQLQFIDKSDQILIFSQIFLSFIGLGLCVSIFVLSIHVSKQSSLLLNTKHYKYIYGTLYEGVDVESNISKTYFSINFARKMLFIIFLVGLYHYPLFQTSFCCAASFLNLMLLLYQNPFESKIEYIQNAVPDAVIFFVLIICTVFAYDDREQKYSTLTRTNLGWTILTFIGISVLTQLALIVRQYIIDLKDNFEWIKGKICKNEKKENDQ